MTDEGVPHKKVDEDWKRRVADEKQALETKAAAPTRPAASPSGPSAARPGAPTPPKGKAEAPRRDTGGSKPDPRFIQFLQSLAAQGLMALGQVENPMTGQPEQDLRQAKGIIDILLMIEEKTKGNLSREEEQAIKGLLQELQSIYVQLAM